MVVLDRLFSFEGQKKWLLVALDRWWLSYIYTVMLVWELAWADSALVATGKWSSYRGGGISRFDSVMFALNLACNRNKLFKTLDH